MRSLHFILLILLLIPAVLRAQTAPVEGLRENPPGTHALTNVRIVIAPGRVVPNGTLVIRAGIIEAVGSDVQVPADARVWDVAGRTVYPGFIDAYADVGMRLQMPEAERDARRGAVYWNPQVRAFVDALGEFAADDEDRATALRSQGFAVAMTVPRLGMFRGQTAVVSLGGGAVAERVIRPGVAQSLTYGRDNSVGGGYPTSAMGAVAFVRQTLHDADWHARAHTAFARSPQALSRPETSASLAALAAALRGEQPLLVETRSEEELLRALDLGREFGSIRLWLRGSGSEYRLLERLGGMTAPLILPLNFPRAPDVARPEQALNLSLAQLRHWHQAPANAARLAAAGVRFALTTDGLAERSAFLPNLRTAVKRGLAPDVALAALTTVPAEYLGITRTHGTLERGKVANIVVVNGDVFAAGSGVEARCGACCRARPCCSAGLSHTGAGRIATGDGVRSRRHTRTAAACAGAWRHHLDDGAAGCSARRRFAGYARSCRERRAEPAGADWRCCHRCPRPARHAGSHRPAPALRVAGGVNETGSAIVPEVRIGDVLTIDNIWMYRQLAGGLTTAHLMHGSANPIGGQNQHMKMRWGALPSS
jgi:imidazolonepropionase-like amidohydrolase